MPQSENVPQPERKPPLVIDLYCGLGGWSEGFLSEGYTCVGFDIERHDYGSGGYPGQLVLQDVTTIHGSQFKDAAVIVASPPCQAYSYRAMPWKRAKALPPPSNELFDACFRIQREANTANGIGPNGECLACGGTGNFYRRDADGDYLQCEECDLFTGKPHRPYIPLLVENVKGAQPWVGRAKWHYGSFYLWGDVPALMPSAKALKGPGGDWFKDGRQGQGACIEGLKIHGQNRSRFAETGEKSPHWNQQAEGVKQNGSGSVWFDRGIAAMSSKSNARKAASAQIAKIPFALSSWIARVYRPEGL